MRPTWTLFPKLYRGIPIHELAQVVRFAGLETTNVVIREGYDVDEPNLRDSLPAFLASAAAEGLAITRAETTYTAAHLLSPETPLPVLRDNGIREIRIGWFPRATRDVRGELDNARALIELVSLAAERYGVKAVYQLHHRTLITNPNAGYRLVQGLNPQWIGIELDPGNQAFEGYEPWDHACGLLQDYVAWVAVKDVRPWQEVPRSEEAGKGWHHEFCPISEGVTNWQDVVNALASISFAGPLVFMPFYDEHDALTRTHRLRDEVEYLRTFVDVVRGR